MTKSALDDKKGLNGKKSLNNKLINIMGRYKNGINGPFSGKIGSVVGSSWCGIDYMKSLQEKSSKPPSAAQQKRRKLFGLVCSWLKPVKEVIWVGYQLPKGNSTPMNKAISFILKEAVINDRQGARIDFTKVVLSKGELLASFITQVLCLINTVLHIKWEDAQASAFCRSDDKASFVVYNPVKEQFVTFERITERQTKEAYLRLPADFSNNSVHCYMHYVNVTGDKVSTGIYLGEFRMGE